jgi:hypothetical protein
MTRPGLLYVLSSGRSGSTLLELLLSTHPDVTTVGELHALGHVLDSAEQRCGCGSPMRACPVWSTVAAGHVVERAPVSVSLLREAPGVGRVIRARWLTEVLRGWRGPMAVRFADRTVEATADVLGAVAVAGVAQPRWWVDASKDPYRFHLLATGSWRPLVALHVVRDPRGFVHAMAGTSLRRTVRMALRWDVQQLLFARVATEVPRPARLRVRYEDLATSPADVLRRLAAALEVDPSRFAPERLREQRPHAVAGNAMRFDDRPVTLDERWKRSSPWWQRQMVWLLCGPQARGLGYRWRSR